MCLSDSGVYQVSVEAEEKHAANSTSIAAKLVRKTRFDGVASRGSAGDATTQYSADGFAMKVNGTAVNLSESCFLRICHCAVLPSHGSRVSCLANAAE